MPALGRAVWRLCRHLRSASPTPVEYVFGGPPWPRAAGRARTALCRSFLCRDRDTSCGARGCRCLSRAEREKCGLDFPPYRTPGGGPPSLHLPPTARGTLPPFTRLPAADRASPATGEECDGGARGPR